MSEEPTKAVSPLRQRMIDDMRMRKLSDKTQIAYIRAVRRLARFLGRSPDTATAEDVRRFQLHLVDVGMSAISINATITALKFFFEATVGRPELGTKMRPVRVEHKLPVVLSREEVARLIESAGNLKYRTALSVTYGAGLRASEVVSLKTTDVDSERMTLRIEQGKGHSCASSASTPIWPLRHCSCSGSCRCARPNGSSTPSAPSPGRRRCSPICRATPTGWPSPTGGSSPSTSAASPSTGRTIGPRDARATRP